MRNRYESTNFRIKNDIEQKLDEADKQTEQTEKRYTHDEMFTKIKALLNQCFLI